MTAEVLQLHAELAAATADRDLAREQRDAILRIDDPLSVQARRQIGEAAYQGGWADGWREGYAQAEVDEAAEWHCIAHPIAQPESYERESAARRLRAAEAGGRRDLAEHERVFVARAFNILDHQRTDVQRATVQVYPPPARRLRRSA
jgi:hypothetical protein